MLLGRPWLYSAKVLVDWGAKEFIVGKPPLQIPWKAEKYLGETSESDGYTSGWSDPEDSDSVPSYFVTEFSGATEEDFGFSNPIPEEGCQVIEEPGDGVLRPEDRSLGTTDVPLTLEWIQGQVSQGSLPAIGLKEHQHDTPWSKIRARTEESEPDPVKNIVSPTDYEKMEVEAGKTFYLERTLDEEEKSAYSKLLKEFADVFAWSPSDLTKIPSTLGEHQIDLVNGAAPIRQRQYRLNPRYSLMVKEEIDWILEAGFTYPVSNSEWVSPIVVVPKKVGADGKVKIQVCQDFRKLNAATKKDYFPLPFTSPAPLLEECPQHHGHKGDPGVTPGTCGAIGERAQVILVWVRAPGRWERLPPTETRSHEG